MPSGQVHGHVSRMGEEAVPPGANEIIDLDAVEASHSVLDPVHSHFRCLFADDGAQLFLGQVEGDLLLVERREGLEPQEATLELSDIGSDVAIARGAGSSRAQLAPGDSYRRN